MLGLERHRLVIETRNQPESTTTWHRFEGTRTHDRSRDSARDFVRGVLGLRRPGDVNRALTTMANAVRVGDRLVERMDARQPESEAAHVP
jgi:hypothetical protein